MAEDPSREAAIENPSETVATRVLTTRVLLLLGAGLFVFLLGLTFVPAIPGHLLPASQLVVLLVPAAVTVWFWTSRGLRAYWEAAFAYLTAATALMFAGHAGDWALAISGRSVTTAAGFAALKLGEDAAIVATIVVLTLLIRRKLDTVFLAKGRLGLGLKVGLSSFLVLALLGLSASAAQGIATERAIELLPVFGSIAVADGITEELLFRGLFLKKLDRLVGPRWANVVTAAVFSLAHMQVPFVSSVPVFLASVFLIGLLLGWLMRRTGSLLAPALVHAGADMLIIADALATFGVQP